MFSRKLPWTASQPTVESFRLNQKTVFSHHWACILCTKSLLPFLNPSLVTKNHSGFNFHSKPHLPLNTPSLPWICPGLKTTTQWVLVRMTPVLCLSLEYVVVEDELGAVAPHWQLHEARDCTHFPGAMHRDRHRAEDAQEKPLIDLGREDWTVYA